MATQAAVSFFYQSGFTVAIGKTLMIFSYWEEHIQKDFRLCDKDFRGFNNIVVFVPRASAEHNDPVIFNWSKSFPISYVLTDDLKEIVAQRANIHFIRQGENLKIANVKVRAYGSTDSGISLMANCAGINIFHAGDLNLWHWREESTLHEINKAENDFYRVVSSIDENRIDICMFPLDPNLGGLYDAGANHFIMAKKPRMFFPMHWSKRTEIAEDYARRMHTSHTTVYALTQPRQTAIIDFTVKPPFVRDSLAERKLISRSSKAATDNNINLSAYISEDPFSETDLPVDLPKT